MFIVVEDEAVSFFVAMGPRSGFSFCEEELRKRGATALLLLCDVAPYRRCWH